MDQESIRQSSFNKIQTLSSAHCCHCWRNLLGQGLWRPGYPLGRTPAESLLGRSRKWDSCHLSESKANSRTAGLYACSYRHWRQTGLKSRICRHSCPDLPFPPAGDHPSLSDQQTKARSGKRIADYRSGPTRLNRKSFREALKRMAWKMAMVFERTNHSPLSA